MTLIARFIALAGFRTSDGGNFKYSEIVGTKGATEARVLAKVESPAIGVDSHEASLLFQERQPGGSWVDCNITPNPVAVSGDDEVLIVVPLTRSEMRVGYRINGLNQEPSSGCGLEVSGTLHRFASA